MYIQENITIIQLTFCFQLMLLSGLLGILGVHATLLVGEGIDRGRGKPCSLTQRSWLALLAGALKRNDAILLNVNTVGILCVTLRDIR